MKADYPGVRLENQVGRSKQRNEGLVMTRDINTLWNELTDYFTAYQSHNYHRFPKIDTLAMRLEYNYHCYIDVKQDVNNNKKFDLFCSLSAS